MVGQAKEFEPYPTHLRIIGLLQLTYTVLPIVVMNRRSLPVEETMSYIIIHYINSNCSSAAEINSLVSRFWLLVMKNKETLLM